MPVHLSAPVWLSRPSNASCAAEGALHSVFMSSRFTKKSLVNVPGRSVNTPCSDCPVFAFKTRMPPRSAVISGAVSVSMQARSTSRSSGLPSCPAWR